MASQQLARMTSYLPSFLRSWRTTAVLASVLAVGEMVRRQQQARRRRVVQEEEVYDPMTSTYQEDLRVYEASLANDKRVVPCRLSVPILRSLCAYDPSAQDNAALRLFAPIKQQTHCVFAKQARIWCCREWDTSATFEANVASSMPAFTLFASCQKRIDGFLWAIPQPPVDTAEAGLQQHAATLRALLHALSVVSDALLNHITNSELDPTGYHCMRLSYVGRRGWVFSFASEDMFVTSFHDCYGQDSARYTYGVRGFSFILFQPYTSFLLHNVGNDTPHTEWEHPVTVRDRIRSQFKRDGKQYFIPEDPQTHPAALEFVPPLHLHLPHVEWWHSTGYEAVVSP